MGGALTTIGFDADDTLWHNERYFALSHDRFAVLLAEHSERDHLMARLLEVGPREDRALVYLLGFCGIAFAAQLPGLARQAHLEGLELNMLLGGTLMATLFLAPLLFYALAFVAHLIARAVGGKGPSFNARIALFWSLLASSPLILLNGLVAGYIGAGIQLTIVGLIFNRLLGATVIVEAIFAIPGMGSLIVRAAINNDFPVVQGVVLSIVIVVVLTNLVIDILYGLIDPRVSQK